MNAYAYLLLLSTLTTAMVSYFSFEKGHHYVICFFFGISAFVLLTQTFRNFVNYYHRKRIFTVLLRRNRNDFHFKSFEDYVDAPCHRMVIRLVLLELNQKDKYKEIIKKYYLPPWKRHNRESRVIFFKNQEEAQEWLQNQKI